MLGEGGEGEGGGMLMFVCRVCQDWVTCMHYAAQLLPPNVTLCTLQEGRLDPTDLPPSEIATAVQRHIKRIADQAFWDAVEGTLSGTGPEGGPSLAPAQQVVLSAVLPSQTLPTINMQALAPICQLDLFFMTHAFPCLGQQ